MQSKFLKSDITLLFTNPWGQYLWLVLVTLLAAALRFYKLGEWSFWIDEIFTINHAIDHFSTMELILENVPPDRNWVPVSVMLTAQVLKTWGSNEWNARLVAAVFGILTIPLLYFIVKRLFDNRVAMIAVLLLALAPWHIEWSQTARFYTALMFFYVVAFVFYFYGIEQDQPFYILIFVGLLYFAASERFFAVFIIPVVLGYLLLLRILRFEEPPGLNSRNVFLTVLPILAGVIVEIISYTMDKTFRLLGGFDWFFLYQIDDPIRLLSFISFDVGVPLISFSFFSGVYLIAKKSRVGLLLFLNAVIPIVLLMFLSPFLFTLSRYAFITLPSWIILGAVGIRKVFLATRSHGRIIALGLLFLFLADSAGSSLLYYQVNHGNRLDWKEAFAFVREQRQVDDELVTWWTQWEGFYWEKEIITWEGLTPESITKSGGRYWFVLDNENVWGNLEMKYWMEQNAELKEVLYLRRENDFYLRIYLYDPGTNTYTNDNPPRFPRNVLEISGSK